MKKTRMFARPSLYLAALLLAACSPASPPANTAADEAAIRKVLAEVASRFDAGDYDGMLALYVDDVVVSAPGAQDIVGKAAWRTNLAATLPAGVGMKLRFDTTELEVAGNLAYERGTYALLVSDKTSGAQLAQVGGRHIHIFKRQPDGSWKGWRLMENSPDAVPAASPPPR
jgi:ketosteroid isomerase-like protein